MQVIQNEGDPYTWDQCWLREELNSDSFMNNLFTLEERAKICLTTVHTEGSQDWDQEGGEDVDCYLFIPAVEEIRQYLPEREQNGLEEQSYWLRNPDFTDGYIAYVFVGGGLGVNEATAWSGVRLMMWVDIG